MGALWTWRPMAARWEALPLRLSQPLLLDVDQDTAANLACQEGVPQGHDP